MRSPPWRRGGKIEWRATARRNCRWPSFVGVGKSALTKRFLHELPRPQYEAVYLHLTHLPSAGLLKLLVAKLGEVPRRGKDRLFEQILDKARHTEGALLVLVDEAHLLDGDALTDTRRSGEMTKQPGKSRGNCYI